MQTNKSLDSTLVLANKNQVLIVVETLIFFVLDIAAFVGNLMICFAFYRNKRLLTATNVFVLSLSLTDLLQSLLVMPLSAGASFSQEWIFGYFGCQFMEILGYIFAGVSIETLTIIAFNRYLCVAKPLRYRRIFTTRKAIIFATASWIGTASYLGFGIPLSGIEFRPSPNKVVCAPFLDGEENVSQLKLLVLLGYALMFFIASIFIPICYVKVFLALRRHRTRIVSPLHGTCPSSKSFVANVNTNNERLGNIGTNITRDQQVHTKQQNYFSVCGARRSISPVGYYGNKNGIRDVVAKGNSVDIISTRRTMVKKDNVAFSKQNSAKTANFTDFIANQDRHKFNATNDRESYDVGHDQKKSVTIGINAVTDHTNDSIGVNANEDPRSAVVYVDANDSNGVNANEDPRNAVVYVYTNDFIGINTNEDPRNAAINVDANDSTGVNTNEDPRSAVVNVNAKDSTGVNSNDDRRNTVVNVDASDSTVVDANEDPRSAVDVNANSNVKKCAFIKVSEKSNDIANGDNVLVNAVVQIDSNYAHYDSDVFVYNSGITINSNSLVSKTDDVGTASNYRTIASVSNNSKDSVDSLEKFVEKLDSSPNCALDVHDLPNTAANTTENFKSYVKGSVSETCSTAKRQLSRSTGDDQKCAEQINSTPNFTHLNVTNVDNINNLPSCVSKTTKKPTITSRWQSQRAIKEVKLTKLLAVTVVGFYVCWLPAIVYGVLYMTGVIEKNGKFSHLYSNFTYTFPVYMSSTINPLIYATMNKTFRKAFCKLFSFN